MVFQVQYDSKTGLSHDFMNVWNIPHCHYMVIEDKDMDPEQFLRKIAEPLPTYEQYIRKKWPLDEIERALYIADPKAKAAADSTIIGFNTLPSIVKIIFDAHAPYAKRCRQIIMGQTIEHMTSLYPFTKEKLFKHQFLKH